MSNRSTTHRVLSGFAAAGFSAVLLSGCASIAQRDAIEVGSVPDDYRTRHPVVIAEKAKVLQIPVATYSAKISKGMKSVARSYFLSYNNNGSGPLRIQTPLGTSNTGTASHVASKLGEIARGAGIPAGLIIHENYHADASSAAPVRMIYTAMTAQTTECGQWSEDILTDTENKHYKNFGCSIQSNLAAQIADPADLLGPREMGEVDTANRDAVIDAYREDTDTFESTVDY